MASLEAAEPSGHSSVEQDKYSRLTVPSFPIEWAVALCTCNFIVPGLGTLMAGLTLCLPCSNKRDFDCGDTCCSACIQLGIALMQLLLTPVCLVGWIWSCVWGFAFIGQSGHERRQQPEGSVGGPAAGGGVVVVATSGSSGIAAAGTLQLHQPSPSSSGGGSSAGAAVGGAGSGYLNYAFHFKAPVAVHPYGPPPAYTAEAPPPPYEEGAAAAAAPAAAAAAVASAPAATVIVHQPQPLGI